VAMRAQIVHGKAHTCSLGSGRAARTSDPAQDDGLVMVLFPRDAWDAVLALARDLGVAPPEALGAALKLLRARVDEEQARGD